MKKMPLFGVKHKTPHELVKSLNENLSLKMPTDLKDETSIKKHTKIQEEISRCLSSMKSILGATNDQESHSGSNDSMTQLANEVHSTKLLNLLVENMGKIDFEGRKDVVTIFINLLRRQVGSRHPTVDHITENRDVLDLLMINYKNQELALNNGVILRECFRYEDLVKLVLNSDNFYKFFEYVEVTTFDISSDAFLTFKELLTRHKPMMAQFLESNYEKFFKSYHNLINSENYVTRRQALKLLGELLLDRNNFNLMTRYIGNPDNLLMVMNMLKESSKNIQFEAFHVFKVFVANPDKPPCIQEILLRRRDKLLEYLSKFHSERSDDEQFNDEKSYLIKQIKELKPLTEEQVAAVATASTTSSSSPPLTMKIDIPLSSTSSSSSSTAKQQQQPPLLQSTSPLATSPPKTTTTTPPPPQLLQQPKSPTQQLLQLNLQQQQQPTKNVETLHEDFKSSLSTPPHEGLPSSSKIL